MSGSMLSVWSSLVRLTGEGVLKSSDSLVVSDDEMYDPSFSQG